MVDPYLTNVVTSGILHVGHAVFVKPMDVLHIVAHVDLKHVDGGFVRSDNDARNFTRGTRSTLSVTFFT